MRPLKHGAGMKEISFFVMPRFDQARSFFGSGGSGLFCPAWGLVVADLNQEARVRQCGYSERQQAARALACSHPIRSHSRSARNPTRKRISRLALGAFKLMILNESQREGHSFMDQVSPEPPFPANCARCFLPRQLRLFLCVVPIPDPKGASGYGAIAHGTRMGFAFHIRNLLRCPLLA